VLSNLGDPSRSFIARFPKSDRGLVVGNLVFEGLTGCPPLRPLTRASLGVVLGREGSMIVCLKCDPLHYSPDDVQLLLAEYVAQLRATAELALRTGQGAISASSADAVPQAARS
jgi:hypothetical protein